MNLIHPKIVLLTILFNSIVFYPQENIISSGNDVSGEGGIVNYSVGQIAYHAQTDGNFTIIEGVQQAYEISVIGTDDTPNIQLSMSVFPNPVENQLNLSIDMETLIGFSYQLTDMEGRILKDEKITENNSIIDLSEYESSTYFVSIWQADQKLKTFKIIKK
ncbi:MAG: T9SS type A sorting domain-containing protein [Flavobacteriaceae bacterium]|nr:T9SS type A sorting domain-containing protein [Flavobacteriaceae bacterium]